MSPDQRGEKVSGRDQSREVGLDSVEVEVVTVQRKVGRRDANSVAALGVARFAPTQLHQVDFHKVNHNQSVEIVLPG